MKSMLALALGGAIAVTSTGALADVQIPFTRTTLPNGMVVILHEDHAVPTVVVNVSYNVGSRFEVVRRTGFAHLFEHLMFMGTRRAPTKMFDAWMEAAGGWNNAWTSQDRTDYYDVGPPTSLELLMWLESDRLRDLGPLMTLEKLDAQRAVVKNERRQTSENTPYGKVELRLPELLYGTDHPYHHPVIGSHADLEAATVDDVKEFFAKHYDPANASLVVAGDFDPKYAKGLVDRWFGTIPSRGASTIPARPASAIPRRRSRRSFVRPSKTTSSCPRSSWPGRARSTSAPATPSSISSRPRSRRARRAASTRRSSTSRSSRRPWGRRRSRGTSARASPWTSSRAPAFRSTSSRPRSTRSSTRCAPRRSRTRSSNRSKNLIETTFVVRLESLRERASLLNMYQAEVKDPGFAPKDLDRYRRATKEQLRAAATEYLSPRGRVIVRVVPKPKKDEKKGDKK